ncbi:hypothetical protein GCM10027418_19210 [Mariniluteicoccus endophyticus]
MSGPVIDVCGVYLPVQVVVDALRSEAFAQLERDPRTNVAPLFEAAARLKSCGSARLRAEVLGAAPYISLAEWEEIHGYAKGSARHLVKRIPGSDKIAERWVVPADAPKPDDPRRKKP